MVFFVFMLYLLPSSNSLGWAMVTVMTVIIATSSVLNFTEQTLTVRCYGTVTDCAIFRALVEANACDIQEAKARFRRRTSHEPNRMQMRENKGFCSFAFDSAHVKYSV